jgi:perosamine synthetase
VLVAHQVGMPADLDELGALCRDRGLHLIEDAACALGSRYRDEPVGRPRGVVACFSFHPRKVLTTGEGGMITTRDADLAARLRRLRHHGMSVGDLERHRAWRPETYTEVGYNYRLSDLQAAVGVVQMGRLAAMVARRRELAARYDAALAGHPRIEPPFAPPDRLTNYQTYVVRLRGAGAAGRARVMSALAERGVTTRPGIMAAHREPPYARSAAHLPITCALADETLALPLYHELAPADQDRVISALVELA